MPQIIHCNNHIKIMTITMDYEKLNTFKCLRSLPDILEAKTILKLIV